MKFKKQPSTLVDGLKPYNWSKLAHRAGTRAYRPRFECVLCADRCSDIAICSPCRADLPWRERPWQQKLAPIDDVAVCFDFAYPVQQLVHRMKYAPDIALARLLGQLAAAYFAQQATPVTGNARLIPVPGSRWRLLRRGFNQAVELALPIAAAVSVPIDVVSVYKLRRTRVQSTLDRTTRRINARNAFRCRPLPPAVTAIIVDDVITTGATVQAMARAVREAGAARVLVWALAAA